MSNSLLLQIQEDIKNAMKNKDGERLTTVRLLLAAIKQREVDERIKLNENQIVGIIGKMIRQRNDSIEQFQKGNRKDLADREAAEIIVLKKYMPQALTETEVKNIIMEAIATTNATSIKDMARVMAEVKTKAQGKADMCKISAEIKSILEKQTASL